MEITSAYREYEKLPSINLVSDLTQSGITLSSIMNKENYPYQEEGKRLLLVHSTSSRSSVCNEDGELDSVLYFDDGNSTQNDINFIPTEEDCSTCLGLSNLLAYNSLLMY